MYIIGLLSYFLNKSIFKLSNFNIVYSQNFTSPLLRKSIVKYSRYLDLFGFIKITSGESELLPKNEKFASWIVEVILGINLLSL